MQSLCETNNSKPQTNDVKTYFFEFILESIFCKTVLQWLQNGFAMPARRFCRVCKTVLRNCFLTLQFIKTNNGRPQEDSRYFKVK